MNAAQRINSLVEHYIEAVESGPKAGYKIVPIDPDNLEAYYVLISPLKGIYKNHKYIMEFKTRYGANEIYTFPLQPPKLQLLSNIYHVNINGSGGICVDILKYADKWSPMNSFTSVIQSIILLFESPNTSSPYNGEASAVWADCYERYSKDTADSQLKEMTCEEEEEMFKKYYAPYMKKAMAVASTNKLSKFAKWFPELSDKKNIDNEVALAENLKQYQEMYELNKARKARNAANKKLIENNTPDQPLTEKINDDLIEKINDKKPPRWARHQK